MLVKIYSSTLIGINAHTITIEVNIGIGVNFYLVGLPDNTVKESQQRIRTSINNNKYKFPGREITINMAPANIKKQGTHFDLPIAVGILAASKQINHKLLDKYLIIGELSLDGSVQQAKGVLPIAIQAKKNGFIGVIIPSKNYTEASLVDDLQIIGVNSIKDVVDFLNGHKSVSNFKQKKTQKNEGNDTNSTYDFSDVKGQYVVKRAFEIAASGNHNILLIGSPGSGKTMLAKCINGILPDLKKNESIETTKIYSILNQNIINTEMIKKRPFRKPHHTISNVALVGGGSNPRPGEISLAHNGVLFLDELPEFKKNVLEVLRQPLEDGYINISRAKFSSKYPSKFMLIAAMNPCPCGNYGDKRKQCFCSPGSIKKYMNKISGPLLDRIDMHIEVDSVSFEDLQDKEKAESSFAIKKRVNKTREIQDKRFINSDHVSSNAQMSNKQIEMFCKLNKECLVLLNQAMSKLNLSARSYHRILKVARTIADHDGSNYIEPKHIAEAIQYRTLDRINWAA